MQTPLPISEILVWTSISDLPTSNFFVQTFFSEKVWLESTLPTYSLDICPKFRSFFLGPSPKGINCALGGHFRFQVLHLYYRNLKSSFCAIKSKIGLVNENSCKLSFQVVARGGYFWHYFYAMFQTFQLRFLCNKNQSYKVTMLLANCLGIALIKMGSRGVLNFNFSDDFNTMLGIYVVTIINFQKISNQLD